MVGGWKSPYLPQWLCSLWTWRQPKLASFLTVCSCGLYRTYLPAPLLEFPWFVKCILFPKSRLWLFPHLQLIRNSLPKPSWWGLQAVLLDLLHLIPHLPDLNGLNYWLEVVACPEVISTSLSLPHPWSQPFLLGKSPSIGKISVHTVLWIFQAPIRHHIFVYTKYKIHISNLSPTTGYGLATATIPCPFTRGENTCMVIALSK